MYNLFYLIERELTLNIKKPSLFFNSIFINFINITLFKFLFNDEIYDKYNFFSVSILLSLLFSLNLSIKDIFDHDIEDGSIDQMLLADIEYFTIITSKIISFWIIAALPIILALPLVNIFYGLGLNYIFMNMGILLIASFSLISITAFAVLITVNIKRNSLITNLISFPFSTSILLLSMLSISNDQNINIEYISLMIGFNLINLPLIYITSKFI